MLIRNILLSLLVFASNLVGNLGVEAEEIVIKAYDTNRACNNAKAEVAKALKKEGLVYSRQEYSMEGYDHPESREQRQVYLLSGKTGESLIHKFMDKEDLHKKITTILTRECRNVGQVEFTVEGSDWLEGYNLKDGLITVLPCVEGGPDLCL